MRTILLLAYQISPTRGSEYSVGWNFTINLAKNNKVYVLCGASGDHMGDTQEIEQYLKENPNPNIHLIPVKPTRLANFINWPNRAGIFGKIFYLAFPLWQKEAYRFAKDIVAREQIDIVHQLGPIGFREPGYLWKLNKPFIWGPVGGANFINPVLLKNIPIVHRFLFLLKNFINIIQLNSSTRVKKAADKASEIIFCNSAMQKSFERYLGKTGQIISEQGTSKKSEVINGEKKIDQSGFNLVWAGNIRYVKNLPLLFNVLALISKQNQWKLHLIGGGERIDQFQRIALKLNIYDNIIWHGRKQRDETVSIISQCDLHTMTSLSEGNPAVLYEAISFGVPTISLDQDGMHNTLANGNGILVPITTYDETVKLYAKQIDALIENPILLEELKQRTIVMADQVSWGKKIQKFEEIYENAINTYENR